MGRIGRYLYRSSDHDLFLKRNDQLFDLHKAAFDDQSICFLKIDSLELLPTWLRLQIFSSVLPSPMKGRLASEGAKLFVLHKDEELVASAWTQSMAPFASRYGAEYSKHIMLGPDWTHPDYRGQGMHPYLVRQRVESIGDDRKLAAVVETGYQSSIKGFTKNGFVLKKRINVTSIASLWHKSREIDL